MNVFRQSIGNVSNVTRARMQKARFTTTSGTKLHRAIKKTIIKGDRVTQEIASASRKLLFNRLA